MSYLLLFLAWFSWGVWAVAIKKAGDLVGLQWTYVIETSLFVLTLPIDFLVLRKIDWNNRPSWVSLIWVFGICVAGQIGQLATVKVAPHFNANVLTLVTSTYPIASMFIFWWMGSKPSNYQILGMVITLIGLILVCWGQE